MARAAVRAPWLVVCAAPDGAEEVGVLSHFGVPSRGIAAPVPSLLFVGVPGRTTLGELQFWVTRILLSSA